MLASKVDRDLAVFFLLSMLLILGAIACFTLLVSDIVLFV